VKRSKRVCRSSHSTASSGEAADGAVVLLLSDAGIEFRQCVGYFNSKLDQNVVCLLESSISNRER
jgi:uncharacterized protein YigE (DUF2233 family)